MCKKLGEGWEDPPDPILMPLLEETQAAWKRLEADVCRARLDLEPDLEALLEQHSWVDRFGVRWVPRNLPREVPYRVPVG